MVVCILSTEKLERRKTRQVLIYRGVMVIRRTEIDKKRPNYPNPDKAQNLIYKLLNSKD